MLAWASGTAATKQAAIPPTKALITGITGQDGSYLAELLPGDEQVEHAREALSVQVHPGQGQTAGTGDGPKDEAWLVLNAGPRGRIVRGFSEVVEYQGGIRRRGELELAKATFHEAIEICDV